ncbi:MAG: hypothetical protein EOP50_14920 [Sphingobacteriales bacterium]|nr:MAG: hypothetical protein EOP50_14920 [Sphingobacteriales bacterium]
MVRITLLAFLFALIACGSQHRDDKRYQQVQKLAWMEGRWNVTTDSGAGALRLTEHWIRNSDSSFNIRAYGYEGKDSMLLESVFLKEEGGRLSYNTAVTGQNDGVVVSFLRSDSGEALYTFVNRMHDFPQSIRYQPINRDNVRAEIGGNTPEGYRKQTFHMTRIQ